MVQHQILAILFSDIVDYSRLMGEDESLALSLLKKNREVHSKLCDKHKGKIIKEIGDGTLVVFSEAENAINYAIDLMEEAGKVRELKFRIGIHIGEVSQEDKDIFGDGVNIASRIQSKAQKNQVLVSEVVYNNLNNRGYRFRYQGKFQLKNIKHTVKCYALMGEGLESARYFQVRNLVKIGLGLIGVLILAGLWYLIPSPKFQKPNVCSIAVLPFDNLTGQPENQYFCDGIMEDILTQLSYVPELQVTSRTSSMKYLHASIGIPDIARELGVNFIMEGSVRKDPNSVLVTVQLIDARDDAHLWSGRYVKELSMDNIWNIQNEIARNVAVNLQIKISPGELKWINSIPTEDYIAYDLYLKGREYYRRYYPEDNEIAIQLYKKAIDLDTAFALSYAGLSDCYAQKVLRFGRGREMLDSAEYYAKLSILYDESLAEGYKTLGLIERTKNNIGLAISYTSKAVSINSNFSDAISNLGFFLITKGDFIDGKPYLQKAITLNPGDPEPLNYMAIMYYYMGDYEKSKMYFARTLDLEPDNRFALHSYLICLDAQQNWPVYKTFADKAVKYTQDSLTWHWNRAVLYYHQLNYREALYHFEKNLDTLHAMECYMKLGETDRAINGLKKMKIKYEQNWLHRPGTWADFWISYNLTILNLLLENPTEVCEWLKISLEEGRDYMYRTFQHDPILLTRKLPDCAVKTLNVYDENLNERTKITERDIVVD